MNQDKDQLHLLFPIPVGVYDFPYKYSDQELDFLKNTENFKRPNVGNTTSENTHILDSQPLGKLKLYIQKIIDHHFKKVVATLPTCSLYITQSWLNYTDKNQHHHRHHHFNSYISGVLYLNTNDDDSITFCSPTGTLDPLVLFPVENNISNSKFWDIPVKSNSIILFPSYLPHMVKPVTGENTRISLAFNTFVKGVIGNEQSLSELILK